ncbi:MAG: AraC family transcriptional regulator [Gammaproteobacteria bacterium]|nr:AraC family transcriptional regulator [Gammaproteobacteria bacterium]
MKTKSKNRLIRSLAGFDVLTDVLGSLGVRTRLFCRATCAAPWTLSVEPSEFVHFHILEKGSAWVDSEGRKTPIALAPGEVLVIAPKQRYRLVDLPGRKNSPTVVFGDADIPERPIALEYGGKGAATVLVCGSFFFENANGHPVLALLPKIIHLRTRRRNQEASLQATVHSLVAEAAAMRAGAETVISRLTDVLFVHVLREWLRQRHVQPRWLAAFNDRRIAPAMSSIHSNPQASTVDQLAAKVGLSRSRFTVRFSRVVGESPRDYIARVRMVRAAHMLKEGSMPVAAVALATGYESESSFNKAFKRFHQIPPGQFRRSDRGTDG